MPGDDYTDMKDEEWLEHYKVCAMDLMISDHERLREKNKRLESEKRDEGTIKQQMARAIEENRREHDVDLADLVKEEVKKQTLSLLSKEELMAELNSR